MQDKILDVQNLTVSFDKNTVIKDLSFSVNKGDVIAIVGPNGAGKSVLFRALMGLIPYSGQVNWALESKIGYVPQRFNIDKNFPLTVKEFMNLKSKEHSKIISILESVGLLAQTDPGHIKNDEHHIESRTRQRHAAGPHGLVRDERHLLNQRMGWLSGGQFQRILVGWALLDDPEILLFDEPTTGIDIGGEETIYNLLKKLSNNMSLTTLLISHDLNIVYKYATSVLCLNKEKICFGTPSNVLDPQALVKLYGGEAGFYKHEH